jgi:hypothetical protein
MPGNTVKINNSNKLEWYVGDSLIDGLVNWLDQNGLKVETCKDETEEDSVKMELLNNWINELVFPGKAEKFVQILKIYKTEEETVKELCIYTNEHKYRIYAVDRKNDDGYLGCSVTTRKMRAGEDWVRGNDLADGVFIKETWGRILCSIVNYELVSLSDYKKPQMSYDS